MGAFWTPLPFSNIIISSLPLMTFFTAPIQMCMCIRIFVRKALTTMRSGNRYHIIDFNLWPSGTSRAPTAAFDTIRRSLPYMILRALPYELGAVIKIFFRKTLAPASGRNLLHLFYC